MCEENKSIGVFIDGGYKTHVILLTWDLFDESSTARLLREEACTHIDLGKLMEVDKDLLKNICKCK